MSRSALIAILCTPVALAGCSGARPPPELHGLWSAGPAACDAGVGVRFGSDAIQAVYDSERQTLFEHPRYRVEEGGDDFRVRIFYDLPRHPGGARSVGAKGVLILVREPDGRLGMEAHNLLDARTGTARVRIADDPARTALSLEPCDSQHPWREGLRGRA
ncbi:hypothetical protein [Terricaulis sp.]|uniref:hypothetical protein n=1 Tax=Terricaulis sp. TaxID=2768686 RepID=UPI00378374E7